MNLIRIEANAVDVIWTRVKDLLQLAINLNLGEFTIEDVKEKLEGNGTYSGGNNAYKQNN